MECNDINNIRTIGISGNKMRTIPNLLLITLIAGFMLINISGCSFNPACVSFSDIPTCSVRITPFAIDKGGTIIETDFKAGEDRYHNFRLLIWTKSPDIRNDEQSFELVYRTEIRLEVEVIAKDEANKKFAFKEIVDVGKYNGTGWAKHKADINWTQGYEAYHFRPIISPRLKPGHYKIRMKSIQDHPEFKGRPVSFAIGYDSRHRSVFPD